MIRTVLLVLALAQPAFAQDTGEEADQNAAAEAAEEGIRDTLKGGDATHALCLAALQERGVIFTEVDPIIPDDDIDCGILRPLTVSEILPGVALMPEATLRCPAALALADWTEEFVVAASKRLPDRGVLTAIAGGPGYVCRRRNGAADGKLSEHAFGNAIDVMSFQFADGPSLVVEPREAEGTMDESFQDAVRASACLDFTTVLGPGSNASHDDHLHLDIKARNGGYRLCEQGGAAEAN